MQTLLILLINMAFFSLLAAAAMLTFYQSKLLVGKRLETLRTGSRSVEGEELLALSFEDESKSRPFTERIWQPIWNSIQNWMTGKMSAHTTKMLEKKLADAGRPFQLTAVEFRVIQLGLGVGFLLLILLLFFPTVEAKGKVILFSLASGLFGFFYPNYYLTAKRKYRITTIQKMMPDFFDMVNVSIEAGMGLDAALAKVCKRMEGPLSDEFFRALEDMKLGSSRKEAFSTLRDRVSSDQFQSVMNALIQADQLGIGMTKVLRAQTHRIREHRRQAAKEQAMKAPVKMMIPMVLFMFPTLFIVLLGPILVQLVTKWL